MHGCHVTHDRTCVRLHAVSSASSCNMAALKGVLVFLVLLLCCQHGVGYRVYILPEPSAFCLGVFSGDDCITWSYYSANPKLADHSTTLIFTPGVYRYSRYNGRTLQLSVTNVKRFTMIGDAGAELQFQPLFSNIGQVHMRNLTLSNSPRIDIQNVQSFLMENCTLLPALQTSSSYYSPEMYIYNSKLVQVFESTFNKVKINVQSHSMLFMDRCTFINSSSATVITGDSYSTLILNNSNFINNYASNNGIVYTRGSLTINNCLFDRNSVRYSSAAVVYSIGDITITGSNFIRNRASYSSGYRPVSYAYYEGGGAIRGERNINISNCTFSHYTRSSQIVYSYSYNNYYNSQGSYQMYIINSTFYRNGRSIYSYNDVTLINSSFYNATSSGDGGAVYSTRTVTTINCMFINSTTVNGNGGVIYSQLNQSLFNSVFIGNSASYNAYNGARGGALYSQQGGVSLTNCYISNSVANGDGGAVYTTQNVIITDTTIINSASKSGSGGAIYGLNVEITNSALSNNIAHGNGGVINAVQNIAIVNSTFNNNTASTGSGGAMYSGNDVTVTNCSISESSAGMKGGAMYSGNDVTVTNGMISESSAGMKGGAIYSGNDVTVHNCSISESSAALEGGAIYSGAGESRYIFSPNIVLSKSTFISNFATSGGVLYTTGHYHHHMRFIASTFVLNEAVRGGVAHVENSSLSITECLFNNNGAAEDGGVLDLIFSSVSIQDTSLSQNNASNGSGGVFYGQNYSTNFTIEHTVIDHNSAGNGGVFYVRRSNSNIKIFASKLIGNSASNQGGVMDIRGVTLTMDMDTVIANNTAGSSGDVISTCVSQITAYGLEVRLDPVYPQYCLIYDEGNSSIPQPMSQTISTDESTTMFTLNKLIGTTGHEGDTESITTTISERGTTNEEIATTTTFASMSQSTSAATFTSDNSGATHTHSPHEATTSPPSDTTSQLPSDTAATTESNTQIPTAIASTESQSHTDEVMTTSVDVTTPARVNQETSSSLIGSTSWDGHEGSTMSMVQLSIISLMVLCIICTAVCAMMITLFFIVCKRRRGPRLVTQARYKKLSSTDKDLEETKHENEIEEYSFSEI